MDEAIRMLPGATFALLMLGGIAWGMMFALRGPDEVEESMRKAA